MEPSGLLADGSLPQWLERHDPRICSGESVDERDNCIGFSILQEDKISEVEEVIEEAVLGVGDSIPSGCQNGHQHGTCGNPVRASLLGTCAVAN